MDKKSRIWVDGCYDLFHYGHSNGFRQTKDIAKYTIVGVHSDMEIELNKAITVMNLEERCAVLTSCRWVDEVIANMPFVTRISLVDVFNCHFIAHANDLVCSSEGTDCYSEAKEAGRYKEFERTKGISTTELVGRMILRKQKSKKHVSDFEDYQKNLCELFDTYLPGINGPCVYVDGVFDIFHAGHAELLKKARNTGYSVVVGLFSDEDAKKVDGYYPLMNFNERKMGVSACKYVDKIITASPNPTIDFLRDFDTKIVLHGTTTQEERYEKISDVVKTEKIYHQYSYLNEKNIIDRIFENYFEYAKKANRKI